MRKFREFKSQITRAEWDNDLSKWKIKVTKKQGDGTTLISENICDVFLGALNGAKVPDVEDFDLFTGRVFHSSAWPDDYQKEQWSKDRRAVIGSGASSIQIVPSIQPWAGSIDVYPSMDHPRTLDETQYITTTTPSTLSHKQVVYQDIAP